MKKNLEKIRRDRKIFEEKKSQLDAEMTKGRVNMSKIKTGLRNNEITDSPIEVAAVITGSSSLGSSLKLPLNQRKSKSSSISDQNNKSPSSQLAEQSSGMFTVEITESNWRTFINYHASDCLKSFLYS